MWQKIRCFFGIHKYSLQPNGIIHLCTYCSNFKIDEARVLAMNDRDIFDLWIKNQITYDQYKTIYLFAKENRTWL